MTCLLKALKANLLNVSEVNKEFFTYCVLQKLELPTDTHRALENSFPLMYQEGGEQSVGSLIGEHERFTILDIEYDANDRSIIVIFNTKDMIVNDSKSNLLATQQNDDHNLRICYATQFKLFIRYNKDYNTISSVSVWRSRKTPPIWGECENERLSYGGGGYYHCGSDLCQGSWAQTLHDYASTSELPVLGLMNIVINALIHRNEGDSAGNGLGADYLIATQKGKYKERNYYIEKILEQIDAGAVLSPWGEVTMEKLKENIKKFETDYREQESFDDFFATSVTEYID